MSQMTTVLRLLREAGPAGVEAHDLVYNHGITRSAAIVHTLRKMGYGIETLDGRTLPDGRKELATYILVRDLEGRPVRVGPSPEQPGEIATPAVPLEWDCGCVRAADGRSWVSRCPVHQPEVVAL